MPITFSRPAGNTTETVAPATVTPAMAAARAVSPAAADALAAQRSQAGALLVEMFHYLERNAEQHPALAPVLTTLSSAVADYRTGTSPDPFTGVRDVFASIQAARRADPSTPEP